MLAGRFATAESRARFKVEAEATAHLQQPNIVLLATPPHFRPIHLKAAIEVVRRLCRWIGSASAS